MDYLTNLPFNPKPPTIMHVDLNSCFATIEQQANPHLRGRPIVVAAYKSDGGCVLAPSIEAKKLGIKTGFRVRDAKLICPDVVVLEPDPWKYRSVHNSLKKLLFGYSDVVIPKSIDEFVLDLEGCPLFKKGMVSIASEIKTRIKAEIGDWITVSVGIGPNRFLAKTASGLHKPDGLDVLDVTNHIKIYKALTLKDLCGIKTNNEVRLNTKNIFTVLDFFNASPKVLQQAFHAVTGYYWYLRLHGWEIDDVNFARGSYSNSVALGKRYSTPDELAPILMKLVEKVTFRMRKAGYMAGGVHLSLLYKSKEHWHKGVTLKKVLYNSVDVYKLAYRLLNKSPYRSPVHIIAVSCFDLSKAQFSQPDIFGQDKKKFDLAHAVDKVNSKFGDFVITPARMLNMQDIVKDRISFGGVKELEEFMFGG